MKILYRAWDQKNGRMLYPHSPMMSYHTLTDSQGDEIKPQLHEYMLWNGIIYQDGVLQDWELLPYVTNDTDGRPLYKGDLIRRLELIYPSQPEEEVILEEVGEIVWDEYALGYKFDTTDVFGEEFTYKQIRVPNSRCYYVGNIFETPDIKRGKVDGTNSQDKWNDISASTKT